MDILTDITGLDSDMYFLDIDGGDNLVYCIQTQPRANCKYYVDEGVDPAVMFDVGQAEPNPEIINHGSPTIEYSYIQNLITEENGFPIEDVPTEPSFKEYISKLKSNSKYLVIAL